MRHSRQLLALTLLALAACSTGDLTVASEDYAVVYLDAEPGGGAQASVNPVATFFRSQPLLIATSVSPKDSCTLAAFADSVATIANTTGIDAGATLTLDLSGTSVSLTSTAQPTIRTYRVPGGEALLFTPGDTVRVTIPGATGGFVPTTIAARTADAFTRSALPVPAAGQGIDLTWTADTRAGSSMLVSLRYNAPASSLLTRQVFCSLIDDGAFTIPSATLADWRAATVREAVTTRWRTEVKQVANSFIILSSTYSLTGQDAQP